MSGKFTAHFPPLYKGGVGVIFPIYMLFAICSLKQQFEEIFFHFL